MFSSVSILVVPSGSNYFLPACFSIVVVDNFWRHDWLVYSECASMCLLLWSCWTSKLGKHWKNCLPKLRAKQKSYIMYIFRSVLLGLVKWSCLILNIRKGCDQKIRSWYNVLDSWCNNRPSLIMPSAFLKFSDDWPNLRQCGTSFKQIIFCYNGISGVKFYSESHSTVIWRKPQIWYVDDAFLFE